MDATDMRDLLNQTSHFGTTAIVRKLGRGWVVSFRSFGFPNVFKTKREATEMAGQWVLMVAQRAREVA